MGNRCEIRAVRLRTMAGYILILVSLAVVVSAVPLEDPVVYKLEQERFQYIQDDGNAQLVDLWVKASDLRASARYNPDYENVYHLFTRENPSVSQPIMLNQPTQLQQSNFRQNRRTAIIIHGWGNSATSSINVALVPAFLAVEDMNVIVVDWSAGAVTDYARAVLNTVTSGESVARFLNWVVSTTGVSPASFHLAGYSLGGHQSGIIGRNLVSRPGYITSLDPAWPAWITNSNRFRADDGIYTEIIHTNAGMQGYLTPIGQVDFYPNGGVNMPGCNNSGCDHARSYNYFSESLRYGGFTGTRCSTYTAAMSGSCNLAGNLKMGGITPKTGETGIFYVPTNANAPFSMG